MFFFCQFFFNFLAKCSDRKEKKIVAILSLYGFLHLFFIRDPQNIAQNMNEVGRRTFERSEKKKEKLLNLNLSIPNNDYNIIFIIFILLHKKEKRKKRNRFLLP